MNRNAAMRLAAVGVVMAAAFGCASNEVVKKEEPLAPVAEKAQTAASPGAAKAAPATSPAKNGPVKPPEAAGAATAPVAAALESVYFDFDKSDLSQAARTVLAQNAAALKARPDVKVRIEGNCDERGSAEYNLALGERRAKSALQYLLTLGVPAERLAVISYGKEHPAVPGNDESAWAKNRRDDFVVLR